MKTLTKTTKGSVLLLTMILMYAFMGFARLNTFLNFETVVVLANENPQEVQAATESARVVTPTATPTPQFENDVEAYIYEVFRDDFDKAMFVLKGNDLCGAENRGLNPKAVNDNRTWGGIGRDWSIFQINDVFHPVYELNLHTDWKANVDYAKRMFDNDGGTFGKRWTVGKCLRSHGFEI